MIKNILVPLDGSKYADKALEWAFDLAKRYDSSIEMLTVIPLVETFMTGAYSEPGKIPLLGPTIKELQKRADEILDEALRKAEKSKPKLKISIKILEGRPSDKIVETARKGNFDLIVIGSRGLGGIKEFFLGSVSDRVADESTCSVLIVK